MASSKALLAIVVVLILVIAGLGAVYLTSGSGKVTTSVVTTTVNGSGGSGTVTVTTTVTSATGTSSGTSNFNQTLVDLAKAEGGSVTVYGVMDTTDWPTMNKVLMQSFPWMKVNYVGLDPGSIATRGITEFQAGHVQADVFYDTLGPIVQIQEAGAVNPYNDYIEPMMNYSTIDPAMNWHNGFGLPIVIEYNKNLVQASQLPATIEGINASQWSGKLAIDSPSTLNVFGTLAASLYSTDFHSNNVTWTAWLKSVAANHPIYTASGGDVYTDIASGQASIGVGLLNDVIGGNSTSVGFKLYSTTYTLPVMSAMAKNAPHPFTAELLIQWFSSYAGQVALSLTGRTPDMGAVAAQYFGNYIPAGTSLVAGGAQGTYYSNADSWASYYQSIFGQ